MIIEKSSGLIVVDKPAGWTSHDVVGKLRRIVGTRKVGHAGTLDPMATGVLVVGIERATRLLHHLVLTDKAYTGTIRLGQATNTDDAEGEPIGGSAASHLAVRVGELHQDISAAMAALTGDILQVPATVSAIKIAGRRAHEMARAGEAVEIPARPVTVSRFEVVAQRQPEDAVDCLDLDVVVECTSGTYVRALARDLGAALGTGGHLTGLRRTRVGPFTLAQAATLEQLAELDDPVTLPLTAAVAAAFDCRPVEPTEVTALSYGKRLEPWRPGTPHSTYAAVAHDGQPIALLADDGLVARPVLVFAPAG